MSNHIIHHKDCIDLDIEKDHNVSLIYLDPPYGPKDEDTYYGVGDNAHEYLLYMQERLSHMNSLMTDNSNIVVHVDHKYVHNLKVMMDAIFGRENFRNEIIWGFNNPSRNTRWLPRKHQNLLWYGMGDYVFNPQRIPHKTKMNVGGPSAWSKTKIPWEVYEAKGKLVTDWWTDIPAICRNEPEKNGYQTQKPTALMKRIIDLWSNEGDWILDPFMGSGSFLEVGARMNRKVIGCDIAQEAVDIATDRVKVALQSDIFMGDNK